MSSLFGLFTQNTTHSDVERLNYILRTVGQKGTIIVPVQIVSVDLQKHRLIVAPMIQQVTTDGRGIPHAPLHDIPYGYEQAGECVLQIDPQPGDIGIAVCAYRDISRLKATQ
ncbi:Gp138 family membrane-puncturing spike protein [Saccharibacter floricola]|uniref:Phage protein Gp138 N-terminal domain-containing protein n=1 Tax=Saccharibacter floricola DSM 15669 TaxID=1123227 RepID=A0ABQ0P0T8_9PROT|nr:Gp138 family membrane-puncturing spike protein [Saccharibacter floricola]GBQ08403.1 hypothetical protein AA15669_1762 [Saccharibacter floricola DSM 15669]